MGRKLVRALGYLQLTVLHRRLPDNNSADKKDEDEATGRERHLSQGGLWTQEESPMEGLNADTEAQRKYMKYNSAHPLQNGESNTVT